MFLANTDDSAITRVYFQGTPGEPIGVQGVDGIPGFTAVSFDNVFFQLVVEHGAFGPANRDTFPDERPHE